MTDRWLKRLAILRIVVAGYAALWTALRSPHLLDTSNFASWRFDPVGPAGWLGKPLAAGLLAALVAATVCCGLAAAVGWRYRLTGPLLALLFLFVTTYRNSWGQILHTENLLALHLLILAPAPADRYWATGRSPPRRSSPDAGLWAVRALATATVCTYLLAGLTKLRISGWAWVDGEVLLYQVAFDNARKNLLGDVSSPLARYFVELGWLAGPAAVASMVVELAAPVALLGRKVAATWCASAWLFHLAILALMAIVFPYHLLGLALLPLLPIEQITRTSRISRHRELPAHSPTSGPEPAV